ncbi:hypothetical protein [Pseudoalteromonas luteoviolacea]|uniref:Uncharacterized protein n=1 Tax=Pseudoalteromonas luteoviolacea S4054 TaxID=1129367 RepID=A0A0F6AFY2_9GAMM|nr:hypothetical protein [Pseudoalteromonas luteoviolacea]KKE84711.1 hypothetical protein N479_07905 [Pseudoalteromonas luteoviolacea S4054]KZN74408.1 hypothetical protein N481_00745 [Pseudoalteromonas luteoviolacea S4047-1]
MLVTKNKKVKASYFGKELKSKSVLEKISGGRGGGSIVLVDENGRIT